MPDIFIGPPCSLLELTAACFNSAQQLIREKS